MKKDIGRKQKPHRVKAQVKGMLWSIFLFMRYQFDVIIDKLFGLYYQRKLPLAIDNTEAIDPIITQSASSLARKIRKRELTSEKVVSAFIERIRKVNGQINAVVDQRFDAALKEARKIDSDIATGQIQEVDFSIKPFLGVPFTSKESTACEGLSHTFGLAARKGRKARFDAEVVSRMKEAGAILIAVTNIPQLNLWQETCNPLFGTTCNPYDLTRNVGGSSGGEAALIASGGSPLGIGTDIGGSLRIPAFMCGIFGHKPTSDLISTAGLTFRTGTESSTMVVAGPMVRYAEDIVPALKVLLGDQVRRLKLNQNVDLREVRVYYVNDPQDPFVSPFRSEMTEVFTRVLNHFHEHSRVDPERLKCENLQYGGKIWRYWMTQEPNANFNRDIANREGEVESITEICKYIVGQSNFNLAVIFNLLNAFLPQVDAKWAEEITSKLRKNLLETLGSDGILIYPSAPWPASYHGTAFLRPWNFNLFSIWNALKFPTTQVPLGLSSEGLPLGIQIVAAPFQDHLAISAARELENVFGGYVPPFKVKK